MDSTGFDESSAAKTATALAPILIVGFGLYVLYFVRSKAAESGEKEMDLEKFLTARNSSPWIWVGLSFYASAVGSYVVTGPAEFGYYVGILGTFSYAFGAAVPILLIAFFGGKMREIYPQLLSLSDFVLFRFGRATQIFTVLMTILNMSVAATAEYTTLTSLYADFVGLGNKASLIVVLVALVTLTYTAYGGLFASIVTDRAQAVVSLFLVQVVVIYITADFSKEDVQETLTEMGRNISGTFEMNEFITGLNRSGYSSLFTLPVPLAAATIFSEAYWQRSWAATSKKDLMKGAILASTLIFLVISVFGGVGVLVAYAGLVEDPFVLNPNLFAFQIFSKEFDKAIVSSGIGVLILLLATTMSQSAIDSFQNGISASIAGAVARNEAFAEDSGKALKMGRGVLILVNIPYLIIGLQRYSVLSLFLVGNMACMSAFFPLLLGFFKNESFQQYQRDFIPPVSFVLSVITTMIFSGNKFSSFSEGVKFAYWNNTLYSYEYFLCALVSSVLITFTLLGGVFVYENYVKQKEEKMEISDPKVVDI